MGTTQRIIPGVTGQPNWKDLNKSITNIAKTIEDENELNDEEKDEPTKSETEEEKLKREQEIAKRYKTITKRRNNHVKKTFNAIVRTGGGKNNIVKGRSNSIGRAGLKSARKLTSFFIGVSSNGLTEALSQIGFGSLEGKSVQNVIDYLLNYCSDSSVGMDETAAKKASCEILNIVAQESGNDIDKFEQLLKDYATGNGLKNLICLYWGIYIFEHLSQRFEEKIAQLRGEQISRETFKIIKDDIQGQVKVLNEHRPISNINWHADEGKKTIEQIFKSILNVICDDN